MPYTAGENKLKEAAKDGTAVQICPTMPPDQAPEIYLCVLGYASAPRDRMRQFLWNIGSLKSASRSIKREETKKNPYA